MHKQVTLFVWERIGGTTILILLIMRQPHWFILPGSGLPEGIDQRSGSPVHFGFLPASHGISTDGYWNTKESISAPVAVAA
jgi:hypothetical protein